MSDVRLVLVDIEGTTSPTAAVHGALFDDARANLASWLASHAGDAEFADAVADVRAEAGLGDDSDLDDVVEVVRTWIDEDSKSTPLKTIQGAIWAEGFAVGRLQAEWFPDVVPAMQRWHEAGLRLAVFSSGSVTVQRPWFAAGGLGDIVDDYFDTSTAGPKRERESYERIVAVLADAYSLAARDLAFISDVPAELDAAAAAGLQTFGASRPGEPYGDADFGDHHVICSFADMPITERIDAAGAAVATDISATAVTALGEQLATAAADLHAKGWMRATSGNLSAVVQRDPLRLVVTASGVDKGELTPVDVVVVDAVGAPVLVPGLVDRAPSAEAELHAAICTATGAGAVVHIHALCAVVAAQRWPGGIPLERIEMVKAFGGDADGTETVPVIENSQSMAELADRLAAVRNDRVPAVVVARHGMYVWGADLAQARHHAEGIEWALAFSLASADARTAD